MKSGRTLAAGKALFRMIIAAGILFSANAALAENSADSMNHGEWERCGCNNREEVEMYVQNLVDDARHRGMVCEAATMHIPACIAVWCSSSCAGQPQAVNTCVATANEYLVRTVGSCMRPAPQAHISSTFSGLQHIN